MEELPQRRLQGIPERAADHVPGGAEALFDESPVAMPHASHALHRSGGGSFVAAEGVHNGPEQGGSAGKRGGGTEPEAPMNAIDLLSKDHRRVRTLLSRLLKTRDKALDRKRQLFEKVQRELQLHGQLEEKLFYPLLRSIPMDNMSQRVDQALRDHRQIDALLTEISERTPEDPDFSSKLEELARSVERHILVEE